MEKRKLSLTSHRDRRRLLKYLALGMNASAACFSGMIVVYEGLPAALMLDIPSSIKALIATGATISAGFSGIVQLIDHRLGIAFEGRPDNSPATPP